MKIVNLRFIKLAILLFVPFILFKNGIAQQPAVHTIHSSTESSMDEPYRSEFFTVRGIPNISVKTINGNIEVYQNTAINGVQVDLYVERSFSLWTGTRNLDNYRIVIYQRGDQIIASVEDRSRGGSSRRGRDVQFHFVVQVPANSSTDLRTINGSIHLDGLEGKQFLQNQAGLLSAENSSGEIRLMSSTGSIKLKNLKGSMFAKTVVGDIDIADNEGEVRVRSTSGSIYVERMSGALVAATTSGDIITDFTDVSQGIYLETTSGDIQLSIPAEYGYEIHGKALRFDLAGIQLSSISRQSQSANERTIVLRDGGLPVQLSTVSGYIRVSEEN